MTGRTDWREEFDCEECRKWTGKPPVPIGEASRLLRANGVRDFKLVHGCHLRVGPDGRQHHIPTTVLELPKGRRPSGSRSFLVVPDNQIGPREFHQLTGPDRDSAEPPWSSGSLTVLGATSILQAARSTEFQLVVTRRHTGRKRSNALASSSSRS